MTGPSSVYTRVPVPNVLDPDICLASDDHPEEIPNILSCKNITSALIVSLVCKPKDVIYEPDVIVISTSFIFTVEFYD